MAKQLTHIFKPNKYEEKSEETKLLGIYEDAEQVFKDIPYAKEYKASFNVAKIYTLGYHIVSTLLGLACVYLVVRTFINFDLLKGKIETIIFWIIGAILATLLVIVLIGIEVLKANFSNRFFKNKFTKKPISAFVVIGIFVVMTLSILISAVGGAMFSYQNSDKSQEIQAKYFSKNDSLKNQYLANKKAMQEEVNRLNSVLSARQKRSKMWGLTKEENESLLFSKQQIAKIDNQFQSQTEKLDTKNKEEILTNTVQSENVAWITALIVLFLEALLLFCYYFQWKYFFEVKIESENFSILKVPNQTVTQNVPQTDLVQEIISQLKLISNQNQGLQIATTQPSIGYKFGNSNSNTPNEKKIIVERVTTSGNRICEHCGKSYTYKHNIQKFCSDKCRKEHNDIKHKRKSEAQRKIPKIN